MFGISGFELLILILFVLLIFGPDKLPELARTLGKAWRQFKKFQTDMERVIRAEVYAPGKGVSSAVADRTSEEPPPATESASSAGASAETIWAAADEGDDEEEDEE